MFDSLNNRRGFTLVEMLIVIALISVAVSLVYPSMFKTWERFDNLLKTAEMNQAKRKEAFIRFIKGDDATQEAQQK